MPTVPLPEKPSLEQLRKQARDLQRAAHARAPEAVDLVASFSSRADPDMLPLTTAQLVVARRHGFPSWPRLVAHLAVVAEYQRVQADLAADADPATEFLDLACLRYDDDGPHRWDAARRLLAAHPAVAEAGIHVAVACADADRVRHLLAAEPGLARAEGGPQRWQPLMHLAYARHDPSVRSQAVLDTARLLLGHGADPNAGYLFRGLPTPFTVLTGVFGGGEGDQPPHPHATALAEVLLVAGADPNDGQALYNRMFTPDDDHLRLLLAHGLGTGDGGPWHARMPDATDTPTQMLRSQLAWAATHGFVERIRLLAAHHVDVCSPLPGPLFPAGRTPAELAAMAGRPDVAALLVELGAPAPDPSPVDALVAAALAADPAAVEHVRTRHPDALPAARAQHPGLIVRAAAGRVDAVRLLVELGFLRGRARASRSTDRSTVGDGAAPRGRRGRRRDGGGIAVARCRPGCAGRTIRCNAARVGAARAAGPRRGHPRGRPDWSTALAVDPAEGEHDGGTRPGPGEDPLAGRHADRLLAKRAGPGAGPGTRRRLVLYEPAVRSLPSWPNRVAAAHTVVREILGFLRAS